MVIPILVLWSWSEGAIWPGLNYNTRFICHFVRIYCCDLQVLHDLEITSDTSNNCNIFEDFAIFLFSKGSGYLSVWYQLHNNAQDDVLMNYSGMILVWWYRTIYIGSIVSLKCFSLSAAFLFLMAMESVICVFCKWMYFTPFPFYTVCIVQPICLRWEFMLTDYKHETSLQSIIRPLVFCSHKPV